MATIEISISDDEKKWIDAQVAAGCYLNASDYIQELIRRDRQARNR